MIISQKRNCNACLALEINQGHQYKCELGYSLQIKKTGECFGRQIVNVLPSEPCPKPKTLMQLSFANSHLTKRAGDLAKRLANSQVSGNNPPSA